MEITNRAEYNISASHSPVIYKTHKINIFQPHLFKAARKVTAAAKGRININVAREIIESTSDAEEQIALYKHYLNCRGVKVSLKLTDRKYSIKSKEITNKIIEMYDKGYSKYRIAKSLKMHVSTVYYIIKRLSAE